MSIPVSWYLVLSAILFGIGALGVLIRRNVLVMFMCIELMLNSANLAFVSFSRSLHDIGGQADKGAAGFTTTANAIIGRVLPGANFLLGPQAG